MAFVGYIIWLAVLIWLVKKPYDIIDKDFRNRVDEFILLCQTQKEYFTLYKKWEKAIDLELKRRKHCRFKTIQDKWLWLEFKNYINSIKIVDNNTEL